MNYYDISRKVLPSLIHHNSWHKVCVDHFSILISLLLRCTEMKHPQPVICGVFSWSPDIAREKKTYIWRLHDLLGDSTQTIL